MKNVLKYICFVTITAFITACNSNNPEQVAVNFTRALYKADSETAMSFCTKDSKPAVTMILSMASTHLDDFKATEPNVKVINSEMSDDGTMATVDVRITDYYDILESEVTDKFNDETVYLKKVNDEWKVVISK